MPKPTCQPTDHLSLLCAIQELRRCMRLLQAEWGPLDETRGMRDDIVRSSPNCIAEYKPRTASHFALACGDGNGLFRHVKFPRAARQSVDCGVSSSNTTQTHGDYAPPRPVFYLAASPHSEPRRPAADAFAMPQPLGSRDILIIPNIQYDTLQRPPRGA